VGGGGGGVCGGGAGGGGGGGGVGGGGGGGELSWQQIRRIFMECSRSVLIAWMKDRRMAQYCSRALAPAFGRRWRLMRDRGVHVANGSNRFGKCAVRVFRFEEYRKIYPAMRRYSHLRRWAVKSPVRVEDQSLLERSGDHERATDNARPRKDSPNLSIAQARPTGVRERMSTTRTSSQRVAANRRTI